MKLLTILIVLALLCGSCSRPINWIQLKRILAAKKPIELGRSPQTQKNYSALKETLKMQNLTMSQHIKVSIFGFTGHPQHPIYLLKVVFVNGKAVSVYVKGQERIWRTFIKKQVHCSRVMGVQQGSDYALLAINNFPYDLQNVNHWVVWTSFHFQRLAQQAVLKQIMSDNVEILVQQNIPKLKSVPELNHFHLFWRRKLIF